MTYKINLDTFSMFILGKRFLVLLLACTILILWVSKQDNYSSDLRQLREFYLKDVNDWDSVPIVIEKHNLVLFTVADEKALSLKLLALMLQNSTKILSNSLEIDKIQNPHQNSLSYLYDYPLDEALSMLKSKKWTKAIFVREPFMRIVKAYNRHGSRKEFLEYKCCPNRRDCAVDTDSLFVEFLNTARKCKSSHWSPLTSNLGKWIWTYINFVGRLEDLETNLKILLDHVGLPKKEIHEIVNRISQINLNIADEHRDEKLYRSLSRKEKNMIYEFYQKDFQNKALRKVIE